MWRGWLHGGYGKTGVIDCVSWWAKIKVQNQFNFSRPLRMNTPGTLLSYNNIMFVYVLKQCMKIFCLKAMHKGCGVWIMICWRSFENQFGDIIILDWKCYLMSVLYANEIG